MVHENPQIGSDGESEEGSRHSDTAAAAVSAQSAAASASAAATSGGATGTSSSSDLYSSGRGGAGGGSGEGKVSFSGKKEGTVSDKITDEAIWIGFRERILLYLYILATTDIPRQSYISRETQLPKLRLNISST